MNEIDNLIAYDPLNEAEKTTGKSYKTDEETRNIGILNHLVKGQQIREEMSLRDDTHYNIPWVDAVRIVEDLGFDMVHRHTFDGTKRGTPLAGKDEDLRVYWREDGVLLDVSTYRGVGGDVNHLNVYYNWIPDDWSNRCEHASSGGVHTPYALTDVRGEDRACWTWVGHHDARTGLRHILGKLEGNGWFVSPWVAQPHLWLIDYVQEHEGPSAWPASHTYFAGINAGVMAGFPAAVREAVGFKSCP